jgi:pilus assembly protein CpaF
MIRRDRLGGRQRIDHQELINQKNIQVDNVKIGALAKRYRDQLIQEVDLDSLLDMPTQLRRTRVERLIAKMIRDDGVILNQSERDYLVGFIVNEVVGLGPLEKLMSNALITEIMVNGPNEVFVEINGKIISRPDVQFSDSDHIRHIIDRIVAPIGRRIDESNPYVDARLDDGSRVNAIIPPLSLNGPVLTIRRFRKEPFSEKNLVNMGTLTWQMMDFLKACVVAKLNILVSGGTGSGKTTLLNVLGSFIPGVEYRESGEGERIVVIEDSSELQLHEYHPHVLRQESRPPNVEGKGEVTPNASGQNHCRGGSRC